MLKITLLLCAGYALLVMAWVFYLAAMGLQPQLKTMPPFAKVHGYAVFIVAVLIDLMMNWIVASLLFWDWPREWLLTARLQRYAAPGEVYGARRARMARYLCAELLDRFDPRGKHC